MEEVSITRICASAFVALIVTIAGCDMKNTDASRAALADMVKAGASPIDAGCAVRSIAEEICKLHVAKKVP